MLYSKVQIDKVQIDKVQQSSMCRTSSVVLNRYFQHAYIVPIVGEEKRGAY